MPNIILLLWLANNLLLEAPQRMIDNLANTGRNVCVEISQSSL
jgi:hypothetical protein